MSVAATIFMISVPLIVVWLTSQVLYFKLSTVVALILSLVLSYLCAAVASRLWERRSKIGEVSCSELMIWSWYRLQKAEREIERGVRATQNPGSHEEQLQVLHELTAALESKDPYTRGHSRRVERHSFKTGVALGLPLEDVDVLRMSASLHDVGKIRVPNKVLHKPGALSEEERALIQEHPSLGAEMVASIGVERVIEAVRHHHERWDGHGYPDGKAGMDIPLFARVIAVADSYDAIRSHRSYRRGSSRDEAVQVLTEESGHQLDAEVVDAFLTTLPAKGRSVATLTSLATGPGALWRYVPQLFQRFGSIGLAPALGAAGTAVIVASSSFPNPGLPAVASPARVVASRSGAVSTANVWEARARYQAAQALPGRGEERSAARRQKDTAVAIVPGGSGSTDSPPTASREPSTSEPSTSEPSTSEPSTSEPSTSAPSTSEPAPTTDTGTAGPAIDAEPILQGKVCTKSKKPLRSGRLRRGSRTC